MKVIAVFLVLLFVGIVSFSSSVTVFAASVSTWTHGSATVLQNIPFETDMSTGCFGHVENVLIAEWNGVNSACMNGGKDLNVGYLSYGGSYYGLVGFPYTNSVHIVGGMCGGSFCRYSPDNDMLVTTGQTDSGISDVAIYLHVSARIHRTQSSPNSIQYNFDASKPDDVIADNTGQYFPSQAFAVSDNGKWIVAELRNKGLALVNTDSLSIRQIATSGFTYGLGMDVAEDLAVSNDGTSVALTGMNVGLRVYDIASDCGQEFVGDLGAQPVKIDCPFTDLRIRAVVPDFFYGEAPRFFGNGQELELIAHSRARDVRQITFLQAGASADHKIKLLALGDSFTSGEGETDTKYYEPGTDDVFDACHVSTRSYPFLIGRALGIGDADVKSVACAGAMTRDIFGSNDSYWGQDGRLGTLGLNMQPSVKAAAQEAAIDDFQPGRSLQLPFLDRYSPDKVVIGIGGNDTGLMGKLSSCAMPGTCEWAQGDGLRETADEIERLYGILSAFYYHLAQASPTTRFYVVGYPDIIDADGVCDPVTGLLLDHTERVFIEQGLHYLNQIIQAAALKEGFTYLDTEHSLDGKRLCEGLTSTAMNGLRLGDDIPLTDALPMLKVIGAGTFHPTPTGHSLIAQAILQGHPNLQQDLSCGGHADCPVDSPDITPSAYWGVQDERSDREAYVIDFAQQFNADDHQLSVELPVGVLQPLTNVTIEIHSEVVSLGTFSVHADGGMSGRVTIPKDIEPGFHTIHMYGFNRDDVPVDLYQFVVIGQDGQVLAINDTGDTNVPTSPLAKGSSDQARGLMGVLGAQDIASVGAAIRSDFAKPIQYFEQSANDGVLFWVLVVAGVSTLSSMVCIILLLRRWAKPGS